MAMRPAVAGRPRSAATAIARVAQPQADAEYDRRRRDSSPWRAWYGTARWRSKRAAQLADEPLCRSCAADGRVTAARVCDHVEPHRGDPRKFWDGATQSLCDNCHNAAKQREERVSLRDPSRA
jgi:hypothetical protein